MANYTIQGSHFYYIFNDLMGKNIHISISISYIRKLIVQRKLLTASDQPLEHQVRVIFPSNLVESVYN